MLQVSVKDFLEAVVDGWLPQAGTAGKACNDILNAMSWTGRVAAKRFIKTVSNDIEPCTGCLDVAVPCLSC